jgi:hypothetical protein
MKPKGCKRAICSRPYPRSCCVPSAADRVDGSDDDGDDAEGTLNTPDDGAIPEEELTREAAAAEDSARLARRGASTNGGRRIYLAALKWDRHSIHSWWRKLQGCPPKGGFDCFW